MNLPVARYAAPVLSLFILLAAPAYAPGDGQDREVEHMMVKQFSCPGDGFVSMMGFIEDRLGPILTELRDDEKMINEWGLLTHDWGDEYNLGFYMTADNHFDWYAAWIELMNRMAERHDMWFEDVAQHCTKHRDNIYIHYRYG